MDSLIYVLAPRTAELAAFPEQLSDLRCVFVFCLPFFSFVSRFVIAVPPLISESVVPEERGGWVLAGVAGC